MPLLLNFEGAKRCLSDERITHATLAWLSANQQIAVLEDRIDPKINVSSSLPKQRFSQCYLFPDFETSNETTPT